MGSCEYKGVDFEELEFVSEFLLCLYLQRLPVDWLFQNFDVVPVRHSCRTEGFEVSGGIQASRGVSGDWASRQERFEDCSGEDQRHERDVTAAAGGCRQSQSSGQNWRKNEQQHPFNLAFKTNLWPPCVTPVLVHICGSGGGKAQERGFMAVFFWVGD